MKREFENTTAQPPETSTQEETGKRKRKLKLTERREKVLDLLRLKPRSVTELTILTGFCDPRSYIRYLRKMGYTIADEWCKTTKGAKYKVYSLINQK